MPRFLTGLAWLLALATIGTVIANEISDDPEYYVPVITGVIAAASVSLAWYLQRRSDSTEAGTGSVP